MLALASDIFITLLLENITSTTIIPPPTESSATTRTTTRSSTTTTAVAVTPPHTPVSCEDPRPFLSHGVGIEFLNFKCSNTINKLRRGYHWIQRPDGEGPEEPIRGTNKWVVQKYEYNMRARNHIIDGFVKRYIMDGCSLQLSCEQDYIPVGNGSTDAICHNGSWSLGNWNKSLDDNERWLKCELGNMSTKIHCLL